jgi:hypothetical protein
MNSMQNIFIKSIIFLFLFTNEIFGIKIRKNDLSRYVAQTNKNFQTGEKFDVVFLDDLVAQNANITIQKCLQDYYFDVAPFPLSSRYLHQGYFKQPFILFIAQGKVQSDLGLTFCEDKLIQDMIRCPIDYHRLIKNSLSKILKYDGRLAVIAQYGAFNYFHWTNEVLGRLALIEMQGIEYDKLYVPMIRSYMKEFLIDLWGIDPSKIIPAEETIDFVQADELIVPSMIYNLITPLANTNQAGMGHYIHPILIKYVHEKILFQLKHKINIDKYNFSKRIFISRKDAPFRKIINEDEIFNLFEAKGFKRYVLSQMSVIEQIVLFHNAEIIVGEHGAGLTNILFCEPKTKVIELFQALVPADYWWISRVCDLDYSAVKMMENDPDLFFGPRSAELTEKARLANTKALLHEIKKIIATL